MQCPLCIIELNMTSRDGIEIDVCPKCCGIWMESKDFDRKYDKSTVKSIKENIHNSIEKDSGDHHNNTIHGFPRGRRFIKMRNRSKNEDIFNY